MKRVLQIIRDGHESRQLFETPLLDAEQGNMQTLGAMIEMVAHDRTQPDLRRYVLREIVGGVSAHRADEQIARCFEFAQRRIVYQRDPWGVERVSDFWSTLAGLSPDPNVLEPEGDCGIKSTFFATCVALLGHRPAFVIAKQRPEQEAYNHIYAAVAIDGEWRFYDPTPEDKPAGYQVEAFDRRLFEIF